MNGCVDLMDRLIHAQESGHVIEPDQDVLRVVAAPKPVADSVAVLELPCVTRYAAGFHGLNKLPVWAVRAGVGIGPGRPARSVLWA